MTKYRPVGALQEATRYDPVPSVGRRRRPRGRPRLLAQLAWLCIPGLFPLVKLASPNRFLPIDVSDMLIFLAALLLAVRAWVAPAYWSVRALGVVASLSYPLMRVVLG